ncbi:MAG: PTS sugar transporter subunit IIA [Candidatus Mcinerneyibacterium aminivorans]|uniref:PTS sugar transporter subunit IIA n=1 Tax=Candidatus Mcinerneyibacterium aminivorans TaxID=2703815 RepID=A0A5D0MG93_9BACT|nr:MAG: PTS sugar transporter subunit IIA [Candidatus Mcinerneyibacterium aminivorans]
MNLREYFDKDDIIIENKRRTKKEVLKYLTELASNKHNLDKDYLFNKILERERKLTTGIGGGLAVPHARLSNINKCHLIILINKKGIDFEAMDDNKVNVVVLILSPKNKVKNHIALLSKVSYLLTEENNIDHILKTNSTEEIVKKLNS